MTMRKQSGVVGGFGFFTMALIVATMALPLRGAITVTANPADGATGVDRSAAIVFTFSEPVDTLMTSAMFFNPANPTASLVTLPSWNAAGTQLTCTLLPTMSWPANAMVVWSIMGENEDGDPVDATGMFSTVPGASGTGTNAVTAFSVGIYHAFEQNSAAAPVVDPEVPYAFKATTLLSSNHTASSVTVSPPTAQAVSLEPFPLQPENFYYFEFTNNLDGLNLRYPAGQYQFAVTGTPTNQQVTVTLPAASQQPNAPQVINFDAAQAVDATQSFTVNWHAFNSGTSADIIQLVVGNDFKTPVDGSPGMLNGLATSLIIPANRLRAATNYVATLCFIRLTATTNSIGGYYTTAERVSTTDFPLVTIGGGTPGGRPGLTNFALLGGTLLQFDLLGSAGQSVTLEWSETLLTNGWTTGLATNLATGRATIFQPFDPAAPRRFYRLRTP